MNNEEKFWAYLWSLLVTVIIACSFIAYLNSRESGKELLALVDKGINPIVARCAILGVTSSTIGDICNKEGSKP